MVEVHAIDVVNCHIVNKRLFAIAPAAALVFDSVAETERFARQFSPCYRRLFGAGDTPATAPP